MSYEVDRSRDASHSFRIVTGVFASAGIGATTFDALAYDIEAFVVIEATADYDRDKHESVFSFIGGTTGEAFYWDCSVQLCSFSPCSASPGYGGADMPEAESSTLIGRCRPASA